MKKYHETEFGKLYHGDCLEVMQQFEDKSFEKELDQLDIFREVK